MKRMIEAILGKDPGTVKRAVASIITYVADAIVLFGGVEIPDEKVEMIIKGAMGIITALVWIAGFYFNENYTEAGCEGTGYTRMKKAKETEPVQEIEEDWTPVQEYGEEPTETDNYIEELFTPED